MIPVQLLGVGLFSVMLPGSSRTQAQSAKNLKASTKALG